MAKKTVYMFLCMIMTAGYCFAGLERLELLVDSKEIHTGDPLVFKMVCDFSEPQLDLGDTNELLYKTHHNCFLLVNVREADKKWLERKNKVKVDIDGNTFYAMEIFPSSISMSNKEGNIYSDYFIGLSKRICG